MKKRRFPIFWCIYALLVIASVVTIHIFLAKLTDVLYEYEQSQPIHYAEQVFNENFAPFDAEKYLEKFEDSLFKYETRENVANYLMSKTEGCKLSFYSVSSAKGTYKYSVKADNVKIASFSLYEEIAEGDRFPTYTADDFEVYFATNESVELVVPMGATVSINGKQLSAEHIVEDNIADKYNEHMPEGVAGKFYTRYELEGLVCEPQLYVVDEAGAEVTMQLADKTFVPVVVYDPQLKADYSEYVLAALENYATYIQGRYSQSTVTLGSVIRYFDPSSEPYQYVKNVSNRYVNSYDSYEFKDELAEEFIAHDENTFSCRVSFAQVLHLAGAEDYIDTIDYTLFLRRVGDKYLIYDMIHN
ncbi:MAG: hypothetical protein IJ499_06055 [Clostridia bacterium]|nr:hypothetical protein [Clostridia bacterium]